MFAEMSNLFYETPSLLPLLAAHIRTILRALGSLKETLSSALSPFHCPSPTPTPLRNCSTTYSLSLFAAQNNYFSKISACLALFLSCTEREGVA